MYTGCGRPCGRRSRRGAGRACAATTRGDRVTDETVTETDQALRLDPAPDATPDADAVAEQPELAWSRVRAQLEETISPQHRAFIGLSRLDGVVGDTALLSVPHQFAKDVIEQRLRDTITAALTSELGRDLRVAVVVDPSLDASG